MSVYFNNLAPGAKARYQNKLSAIDYFDPYSFPMSSFNITVKDLPEIHIMDIISYFVMRNSFYTEQQIKAAKALDAYKYYDAGFVKSVCGVKINGHFLVIGEVGHSQRMNDPKLKPWMILDAEGSIDSAHCNCMAGLGESCSHIAAMAFSIHLRDEEISATDKLCAWTVPIVKKKITPQPIKNIDWGKQITSYKKNEKLKNVTPLSGETLIQFLKKCERAEPNAVIFNVMQPFAEKRVPETFVGLPQTLMTLYDPKYSSYTLEELRNVNISFEISEREQDAVLKATLNQSKSIEWYKHRNGRITSSNFKSACKTSVDKPSRTLINSVCYATRVNVKCKPLIYGLDNEENVRKAYCSYIQSNHTNANVTQTGFIVSLTSSIFGSSIDAFVSCACCGKGCCEFKCPYRMYELNLNMEQFIQLKDCYIKKNSNGQLSLDKSHQYYYQVQMHMFCTQTQYCDFVVWSKRDMYIERIKIDQAFLNLNLEIATNFHKSVIVPEILAKWYTKPKDSVILIAWCECCMPDNGEPMIKCCNEQCPIQWFHVKCVLPVLDSYNELEWYCKACVGQTLDPMDWQEEE